MRPSNFLIILFTIFGGGCAEDFCRAERFPDRLDAPCKWGMKYAVCSGFGDIDAKTLYSECMLHKLDVTRPPA
jgi:hypothetical protein